MEPCTSSLLTQTSQHHHHSKDKKPVKRSTSLVNVQAIDQNPKVLNRRVTKSSKNLRISIKDTMNIYTNPFVESSGEAAPRNTMDLRELVSNDGANDRPFYLENDYKIGVKREDLESLNSEHNRSRVASRYLSPVTRVSTPRPTPNILERLSSLLDEQENGKFKRQTDFSLTLVGTNMLYWKEVDKVFLFGFIAEKKAKKATVEALNYIQTELAEFIRLDQKNVPYQELVRIYENLRENKTCQQVFKDKPELKFNFSHLMKLASITEPTE